MHSSYPRFEPKQKVLVTERLHIRIDTEEEYVGIVRSGTDLEIKERFGFLTDAEVEKQREKVVGGLTTYRTSVLFFHLILRSSGQVIGNFAYHNWYPSHNRSEVGYAMQADEHKGQGYMREAMSPIIDFGFREMGLNRMEAFIDPKNIPSRRLVERSGFREEAVLLEHYIHDGVTVDSVLYRLLREEYIGNKGSGQVN
jgi:ribosomal-protein-alanine N-acetyltransferase